MPTDADTRISTRKYYFLDRGDPDKKGEEVSQSFLPLLMRNGKNSSHWRAKRPEGARTSHQRKALADWLTDVKNGAGYLVARVIMNRLWQHHFGRGLVATPNDFGYQSEPPTHPELLDWLACRLIENGWRLKPMHKLILSSACLAPKFGPRRSQGSQGSRQSIAVEIQPEATGRRSNTRQLTHGERSTRQNHVRKRNPRREKQKTKRLLLHKAKPVDPDNAALRRPRTPRQPRSTDQYHYCAAGSHVYE